MSITQNESNVYSCIQKILPQQQQEINEIAQNAKSPEHLQALSAAFFAKKLWPQRTQIKVAFAESDPKIRRSTIEEIHNHSQGVIDPLQQYVFDNPNIPIPKLIEKIVNERIAPISGLDFIFDHDHTGYKKPKGGDTDSGDPHVLISFDDSGGAWSLVGTDCKKASGPTMNLGWFNVATVMHEFGHVLGMIHEHQNPRGKDIEWNKPEVYTWALSTQGWDKATTDTNIINHYKLDSINSSDFDPQSIMLYFFPPKLTLNNQGTSQNLRLSGLDVLWINKEYTQGASVSPKDFYQSTYNETLSSSVEKSQSQARQEFNKGGGKFPIWIVIVILILLLVGGGIAYKKFRDKAK
jgi:hypothetical protein